MNKKERSFATSKLNAKTGFTLIELLVVVAIIGMLASTVLIGLTPARKFGRDARRVSDVRNVQNILELYYSKNGLYPNAVNCSGVGAGTTGWTALGTCFVAQGLLTKALPNDPNSPSGATYNYVPNGTGYVMGTQLENPSSDVLKDDMDGNVAGLDCEDNAGAPASTHNYCVINP